jgi:hypothetical protein
MPALPSIIRRNKAAQADPYALTVRDIGIASAREPDVSRPEGSPTIYVSYRGTSDAWPSVDRDTRIRISVPVAQAAALWRLLGEHLTDQEKGAADAG